MAYDGTTILLAEDDIILAELYTERLKQEGFTVVHASNGEDALRYVGEYNPALIILDIMMPRMNGLDVLKAIKENPATNGIPVIIVTALVQEIEKINKMMNPADAYIVKSEVLPGEIIEEVKKRLNTEENAMGGPGETPAATPPVQLPDMPA
jgi:DNA-binding response OmpR family regulator